LAAAGGERVGVGGHRDAALAQLVGDAYREVPRHADLREPLDGAARHLGEDLRHRVLRAQPGEPELVGGADVLDRAGGADRLEVQRRGPYGGLVAAAQPDHGIRDVGGDLVPDLRRALGAADEQQGVGHGVHRSAGPASVGSWTSSCRIRSLS